jgi:hypothetical protein
MAYLVLPRIATTYSQTYFKLIKLPTVGILIVF